MRRLYDATRLSQAAAWLESSLPASIAKVALFLVAAGAAGWAASGWAAGAGSAATAARLLAAAATAGVYLLAGLPAAMSLSYDLTAGKVDTHVLMNLAVLGTVATGHALEVGARDQHTRCSRLFCMGRRPVPTRAVSAIQQLLRCFQRG